MEWRFPPSKCCYVTVANHWNKRLILPNQTFCMFHPYSKQTRLLLYGGISLSKAAEWSCHCFPRLSQSLSLSAHLVMFTFFLTKWIKRSNVCVFVCEPSTKVLQPSHSWLIVFIPPPLCHQRGRSSCVWLKLISVASFRHFRSWHRASSSSQKACRDI